MTVMGEGASRTTTMRKIAGYGAAIAVLPYLVIKVAWTFGLVVPTTEMGNLNWRAINATTAVIALVGLVLALAFTQPWGERLPSWLVVIPVWVGTGLLVPLLFLAPVLGPAAVARDAAAGSADTWAYEQVFVIVSMVGVGIGLPVAFASYVRARWPEAVGGPLDCGRRPGDTYQLQLTIARIVAFGCALLGITKIFWVAGGTLGIDADRLGSRDIWWQLLSLSTGVWSLVGAWGLLVLTSRRGTRRFLPPLAAGWVSSGMLLAYNLFFAIRADSQDSPEHPLARMLTTNAGVVLGVMMGMTILLVLHDRRHAIRDSSRKPDSESTPPDGRAPVAGWGAWNSEP